MKWTPPYESVYVVIQSLVVWDTFGPTYLSVEKQKCPNVSPTQQENNCITGIKNVKIIMLPMQKSCKVFNNALTITIANLSHVTEHFIRPKLVLVLFTVFCSYSVLFAQC